jgi:hypothetical protein
MQSVKVNTKQGIGIRRTVWLPTPLDEKAERVRKQLGLGRSAFYRFAVVEVVKQFAQTATEPCQSS